MPTYQTAPLYAPVFPTLLHNPYGVQPLKGNTLAYADLPAPGDSYQSAWKREADMAVMARLQNNKLKEKAMLRGPQSIKGNSTYTTGRGPNGHAFTEQRPSGMAGGVATTKEGETMIQKLLRDRKFQLDAIDQSSFDTVAPERVKEPEPETDTFALDQLFTNLFSSITYSTVTPSLLGMMNSIMTFFATRADKISDNKFDTYAIMVRELYDLVKVTDSQLIPEGIQAQRRAGFEDLSGSEKVSLQKQQQITAKLLKDLGLLDRYIKDYTSYIGYPTKTKSMKLSAIRNKILLSRGKYVPQEGELGYEPKEEEQTYRSGAPLSPEYEQALRGEQGSYQPVGQYEEA
jgi:hypothetical protein